MKSFKHPVSAKASGAVLINSGALFVATTPDISKARLNATLLQPEVRLKENGRAKIAVRDILRVEFPYVNGSGERQLPESKCLGNDPNQLIRNLENILPRFSIEQFEKDGFEMKVCD